MARIPQSGENCIWLLEGAVSKPAGLDQHWTGPAAGHLLRGKVLRSSLHGQGLNLGDQENGSVMVKGRDLEKKSHWEMETGEGKWFGAWGRGVVARHQAGSWRPLSPGDPRGADGNLTPGGQE